MTLIICYATCWDCKFDHHNPEPHPWWDADDAEYNEQTGLEPPEGDCACPCAEYLKEDDNEAV